MTQELIALFDRAVALGFTVRITPDQITIVPAEDRRKHLVALCEKAYLGQNRSSEEWITTPTAS